MTVRVAKAELEKFVEEQVQAGHFGSADEVVEAALAQMKLQDGELELDEESQAAIAESEAQIARGQALDWKQVSVELRRKYLGQ